MYSKNIDKIDFEAIHSLLEMVKFAEDNTGGHLTICRFTTGWKVFFRTPDISQENREVLQNQIPGLMSLSEALAFIYKTRIDIYGDYLKVEVAKKKNGDRILKDVLNKAVEDMS